MNAANDGAEKLGKAIISQLITKWSTQQSNFIKVYIVLKKANKGDFRVQDDFGGTVSCYAPRKKEIDFANKLIASLPFSPIYARVDIILDNENRLALSELELIEPEMWFRFNRLAPEKIALAIKSHIKG